MTAGLGARHSALGFVLVGMCVVAHLGGAQDTTTTAHFEGAPVELDGDTLFRLFAASNAYNAKERAARLHDALERVAARGLGATDTIGVNDEASRSEITLGGQSLFFVYEEDAAGVGIARQVAARQFALQLRAALPAAVAKRSANALWRDGGIVAIESLLMLLALVAIRFTAPRLYAALDRSRAPLNQTLARLGIQGLTGDHVVDILISLTRLVRVALIVFVLVLYVPLALRAFPQTAAFASRLIASVTRPIRAAASGFVDYLPNIVIIAVIVYGTRLVMRGVNGFFLAIERGTLRLKSFDAEWAVPTYEILRPLMLALAFAIIFPYLPGAKSDALKGVSIFLGVLFSLGSSSAVANMMAGVVLLYSRAFHLGDWVRIGEAEGAVIARTLLVTRLRTPKNVEISVPNSVVLNNSIHNFTAQAERGQLILHTTVTIGYDAPWHTVHELLIAAARATKYVESDPAPFVLQTALNDFNISYQINASTKRADLQPAIYAELHQNIQEQFNAAGVEIMSPNYHALRDGNTVTIPESQRPKGYEPPSFRVTDRG